MAIDIPKMLAPSADQLRRLESWLGQELPATYVEFVCEHDGAQPHANSLLTRDNEVGVSRFIPVTEAAALAEEIDGFPVGVILLAEDGCGNYFYVEPLSECVRFWDHELEGQDEIVAPSVPAFVANLTHWDATRAQLAQGQVKHAWIDPEFLASLKTDDKA